MRRIDRRYFNGGGGGGGDFSGFPTAFPNSEWGPGTSGPFGPNINDPNLDIWGNPLNPRNTSTVGFDSTPPRGLRFSLFGNGMPIPGDPAFNGEPFLNLQQAAFVDPYSDQSRQMLMDRLAGIDSRTAPQLSPEQQQWRAMQLGLAQPLWNQSMGIGPSLAGEQLRKATDRNLSGIVAQSLANRGQASGLGARNASRSLAMANQEAAGQAIAAGIQERKSAQEALTGLMGGARQQDIAASVANLEAELRNRGMNDEQIQNFTRMLLGKNEADRNAAISFQNFLAGRNDASNQRSDSWLSAGIGAGANLVGAGLGALGSWFNSSNNDTGDSGSQDYPNWGGW